MGAKLCPACGAKHVFTRAVADRHGYGGARTVPVGPCVECGWAREPAVPRDKWRTAAHLPRPARMSAEEFAMRARLFEFWANHTVREFLSQLPVFADYLADLGSPEEDAARADWRPYAHKQGDPKKWWSWSVPVGAGWVQIERQRVLRPERWTTDGDWTPAGYSTVRIINDSRARPSRNAHNGRWFLCWPPGFVRFGGALHHDPTRWRVTVSARRTRGENSSRPVERVWPAGYLTLLRPYEKRLEAGASAQAASGPTLFDDLQPRRAK